MVKLTLVGRLSDGMPLSQTPTYLTEDNEVSSLYRQKGELVLKEIAAGALTNSKMTILIDHHCFHYLIGNEVCYITLCESRYPRKLAFYYLQDLQKEFKKFDVKVVESFTKPYAFTRFDYVIGNIRKQYLDTRTQANLFKLNSDHRQDLDMVTEEFSKLISNYKTSGSEARACPVILQQESTLWSSKLLEEVALKWTPITILVIATALLLWTSIVLTEYNMLTAW
ncbi:25.3 kDa vesicle transport protein SEC22-1 [Elaeis guineensis]|uniref:25.3 kDa vesicle transport protein SEC22-1 n=1 Tax=Elaeis guineensis var. tenera TaxID=51953 RepID=UPI00057AA245